MRWYKKDIWIMSLTLLFNAKGLKAPNKMKCFWSLLGIFAKGQIPEATRCQRRTMVVAIGLGN